MQLVPDNEQACLHFLRDALSLFKHTCRTFVEPICSSSLRCIFNFVTVGMSTRLDLLCPRKVDGVTASCKSSRSGEYAPAHNGRFSL